MPPIEEVVKQAFADALSCDNCGHYPLKAEHAHYVCSECGYKTKCCEGGVC